MIYKKAKMAKLTSCKNPKRTADGKRVPCPLTELLSRLGDKWSVLIIVALAEAPLNKFRFSELKKKVDGISQRMLTATLRNLERDGILTRHLYPEIPPRVEYELTSLGLSILEPLQSFVDWIEDNWSSIHLSRETFDLGHKPSSKKTAKKSAVGIVTDETPTALSMRTVNSSPSMKASHMNSVMNSVPTLPGAAMILPRRGN